MTEGKRSICRIVSAAMLAILLLVAVLGWTRYSVLKQQLITRLSDRATSFIGHKVEIGSLSFSVVSGITMDDITIRNPDGFEKGELLRIRRLQLEVRYRELFRGKFSFRKIGIDAPQLSLITSAERQMNLSDKLRALLSGKGTTEYQVDEVSINGAEFSWNRDPRFSIHQGSIMLSDLSSEAGSKTVFKASMTAFGRDRVDIGGWAFLRDGTKKFSLSAVCSDIDLAPVGRMLLPYGLDLEQSRAEMRADIEGDLTKEATARIDGRLKGSRGLLFRKNTEDLGVSAVLHFDRGRDMLSLQDIAVTAGEASSIRMSGSITNLSSAPSYDADLKIEKLDLSAFSLLKGMKLSGSAASDHIRIQGDFSSSWPEVSGNLKISEGALTTDTADIRSLNTLISFAFHKELSIRIEASAGMLRAAGYQFSKPAGLVFGAEGKGSRGKFSLSTKLSLAGTEIAGAEKTGAMQALDASFDGTVRGRNIEGRTILSVKDVTYGDFRLKEAAAVFNAYHDGSTFRAEGFRLEGDYGSAAADTIRVILQRQQKKVDIEIKKASMYYAAGKAALSGLDGNMAVTAEQRTLGGIAAFSAEKIAAPNISAGKIAGSGSFGNEVFAVQVSAEDFFRGQMLLSASGRVSGGPFPVALDLKTERLDIGRASGAIKQYVGLPYDAAGEIQSLTFKGEMTSCAGLAGRAYLTADKLALISPDKRNLIRNGALKAEAELKGRDMEIRADATAGNFSLALSGTAERFLEKDRTMHLSLILPEVKLGDIRTAFWDIFPDRLLYAGMKGSVALNLLASSASSGMTAEGTVLLRDIFLEGENGEYSAGPVNGMVPFHYNSADTEHASTSMPSFDKDDFEDLKKAYAQPRQFYGNEITIGSLRYGFRFLEDISLWVEQKGRVLKINRISANMFGGRIFGAGTIGLSEEIVYRAGMIADGISLTNLCEEITPIRGYLSGRVDGIAVVKGTGAGIDNMIGKMDFWTYSDRREQTRISREFLEKIGGPRVRAYLGERRFDRGVMGLYIQNGFLVFRELEISNSNFIGITDLSVKVAPLNNRVAIDHLLWTIATAAERAKKE